MNNKRLEVEYQKNDSSYCRSYSGTSDKKQFDTGRSCSIAVCDTFQCKCLGNGCCHSLHRKNRRALSPAPHNFRLSAWAWARWNASYFSLFSGRKRTSLSNDALFRRDTAPFFFQRRKWKWKVVNYQQTLYQHMPDTQAKNTGIQKTLSSVSQCFF